MKSMEVGKKLPEKVFSQEQEEQRVPLTHELHLLGTVHRDPLGYRKLVRFLQEHQPDLILLELSPYGLAYRKQHRKELPAGLGKNLRWAVRQVGMPLSRALKHPEIQAIRHQLALPFEYRASMKYASHCRVSSKPLVKLVDSSPFSREMISAWAELTSPENLVHLLSFTGTPRPSTQTLYGHARRIIFGEDAGDMRRPGLFMETGDHDLLERREKELARAVLDAMRAHRPSTALYVGGWQHLMPGRRPPTLRDLLHVDSGCCHLLSE